RYRNACARPRVELGSLRHPELALPLFPRRKLGQIRPAESLAALRAGPRHLVDRTTARAGCRSEEATGRAEEMTLVPAQALGAKPNDERHPRESGDPETRHLCG